MAVNPDVLGLLEEMLDSGKTPEEACRDCPDLLPVVRERWVEFCRIDAGVVELLPGLRTTPGDHVSAPVPPAGLPQIPGYSVDAMLGSGGMGVVYKARQHALGRSVAVKMLLAGPFAGPQDLMRFRRETAALACLQHPNIVQVYDAGEVEGRPYFSMEIVEGGSLAQRLSGTPKPCREAAGLVATLAEAVQAAHKAGIVHRDLKPANILLTADGTPKISDFGLARRLDGSAGPTQTGVPMGTPSYMAPEQAAGHARAIGPAADVYALGAILYELLTGRPPFRAETPAGTLLQVVNEEPVQPSRLNHRVPRDLETICLKCLQKEPQGRYPDATGLTEDLLCYLLGRAIAAQPVGRLERVGKWIRRNPAIASLSAAAMFTLLAGTVVSLLFGFEARRQEGLATDRANELERRAIELKAQTIAATENAQRARDKEEEARRALIAGLMIPIEGNAHTLGHQLDNTEVVGLCQLRKASREVRLQFLETSLRDPETARRVGRRADWVIQSIVGCDRPLRDDVGRLLVQRIQEPETAQEVMLACARLGQAANLDNRLWAENSAATLSDALCDKALEPADCPVLAKSLAAVLDHLPRAQAAEHAVRVTDAILTRLQAPAGLVVGYLHFGPTIEVLSPYLDTAAANRAAETIDDTLRRSEANAIAWEYLGKAQLALCRRLPPTAAAAHVKQMVDLVLGWHSATEEKFKVRLIYHAKLLGILSPHLDASVAARVADTIIATLGDGYVIGGNLRSEFIESPSVPEDLARVAERLDAADSLRAAEALIPVLKKTDKKIMVNMEQLRKALVGLCLRLDADGARRVADAIALAVQDPKTPVLAHALLAHGFAVVADKLEPDKAAPLENAVVEVLVADVVDVKPMPSRKESAQALASVCGRQGTKSAPRAAEALTAAIREPQTPVVLLRPFAAALAVVCSRLPPAEVSSQASKAAEALGALWSVKTKYLDRAFLAQATAEVWTGLGPHETAAPAKRMAVDLGEALQDAKTEAYERPRLAEALIAVCGRLDPGEGEARICDTMDILLAEFRKPKNARLTSASLAESLAILCLRLDRNGLARVAEALFTALGDPNVQLWGLEYHVNMFKKAAARMEANDLERLLEQPLTAGTMQRAVLDVLGESKNRQFRNTWDYLDWKKSNGN
jgi:hypothetical protein